MRPREVPQPSLERMVPFVGHPVLVGVVPGQDPLVVRTAGALARSIGASRLDAAYVDATRVLVEELPDGSVRHAPLDPDADAGDWRRTRDGLSAEIEAALGEARATRAGARGDGQDDADADGLSVGGSSADAEVPWRLWYLAGRPDRALTHLARAVDAAVIVVGAQWTGGARDQLRELVEGSVAVHLAHHQHRPVLTVPTRVVDWRELPAPWTL